MIVVKLGGAVITDKARYRALRGDVLARLARELAGAPGPVVLVHGAGSFGHVVAKEHALGAGRRGSRAQDAAAARVHRDVRALNAAVLAALEDAGAPAMSVSPFDVMELDDGALSRFDAGPFERVLAWDVTPVTFGDLVPDRARGWGILSGDVLLEELARHLRASRVIAVTDVDGLFDRPPAEDGAVLIDRVHPSDALHGAAAGSVGGDAARRGTGSGADGSGLRPGVVDVTGGMAGKVRHLVAIAGAGVPVTLLNGLAPGRLGDALAGKRVPGTVIAPE